MVIPVFGGVTNRDAELRMRNPDEWEYSRRVHFAKEHWYCDTQNNDFGGITLGLKLYSKARRTLWDNVEYISIYGLRVGDVFPVLDHLYRYEGQGGNEKIVVFRDVTAKAPREIVPVRGEVCLMNDKYRLCVRMSGLDSKDRRYIGASVEPDGPTGAKAWVHIPVRPDAVITPRHAGRLVKFGEVLNIAKGSVLKVVRIVPPRKIEGLGRLIGWVCFEDPLNAAELAKNAEFHKQRRERERTEPPPVFP